MNPANILQHIHHCADCDAAVLPGKRALTPKDESLCYPCADKRQVEALKTRLPMIAYLSEDEKRLTTWTGGLLASVTQLRKARHNIGGRLFYFRARDIHGGAWFGTSPGPCMYARMRPLRTRNA